MAEELEKLEYEDIPRGETDWDVPVNERFSWIKEEWNKLVEGLGGPTPTEVGRGAIVESGSNGNGHYVRWENGEQLCQVLLTRQDLRTETSQGALYRTGDLEWDLPAEFANSEYSVSGHPRTSASNRHKWITAIGSSATTSSTFYFRVMSSDETTSSDSETLNLSAWGRWK